MYTYRPAHLNSHGRVELGTPNNNAIGVYDGQLDLVALYVHDPSRKHKVRNHVVFFLGMSLSLAALLFASAKIEGLAMIPLVIVFLAIAFLLMWTLILPDYEPNPDIELIKSAAYLTYGPTLDIVSSQKRLYKEYPPNYDTSKF